MSEPCTSPNSKNKTELSEEQRKKPKGGTVNELKKFQKVAGSCGHYKKKKKRKLIQEDSSGDFTETPEVLHRTHFLEPSI